MKGLKILYVRPDTILSILRGDVTMVDFDVPDDARVVRVGLDFQRDAFGLVIESAQFEPTPLGVELPLLPPFEMRRANDH